MNNSGFSRLEMAILDWLKNHYNDRQLLAQIDTAVFQQREWTKVGYFTYLKVAEDTEPINLDDFQGHWPIAGPVIKSKDIDQNGDSIIWGENGFINCIEMYAFGDFFNEIVDKFELITFDK